MQWGLNSILSGNILQGVHNLRPNSCEPIRIWDERSVHMNWDEMNGVGLNIECDHGGTISRTFENWAIFWQEEVYIALFMNWADWIQFVAEAFKNRKYMELTWAWNWAVLMNCKPWEPWWATQSCGIGCLGLCLRNECWAWIAKRWWSTSKPWGVTAMHSP